MVRLGSRLSSLKVAHAREPGMLADGNGLYLQVKHCNARSWIFRYFRDGKSHEMGLGSLKAVSRAAARLKAAECRGLLADGIDPIAARDAERLQRAAPPFLPLLETLGRRFRARSEMSAFGKADIRFLRRTCPLLTPKRHLHCSLSHKKRHRVLSPVAGQRGIS